MNLLKSIKNNISRSLTRRYVRNLMQSKIVAPFDRFDFDKWQLEVNHFIDSMRDDEFPCQFSYSSDCSKPNLYSSAYACMTYRMFGTLQNLDESEKNDWAQYFDSFQSPDDGLFYDPVVSNDIYDDTDWWGARHLALHLIIAYTDLGHLPRYPFLFLDKYCENGFLEDWLDDQDWDSFSLGEGDIDNKVMNIAALLQFERDNRGDQAAGQALASLKTYLLKKINPDIGIWGTFDTGDSWQLSRMVQFAYHLFPIFFYDGFYQFDCEKIVKLVLRTQISSGGYGAEPNPSACEDIDSVDLLIRLYPHVSKETQERIDQSLLRAFHWINLNQTDDGGFVFRLNEKMVYGHPQMSSSPNTGAMFPTWFRSLSIVLIKNHFTPGHYSLSRTPGLVFP
jgi:hypothetical protein